MNTLLTVLLSLYPTIFIYQLIPNSWMKLVNDFGTVGTSTYFFAHLAAFGLIFYIVHSSMKKYISLGYFGGSKRGTLGLILVSILTLAVGLIAFYNVLPGNIIYNSPSLIDTYLLANPFTFIALALPFIYLFFD